MWITWVVAFRPILLKANKRNLSFPYVQLKTSLSAIVLFIDRIKLKGEIIWQCTCPHWNKNDGKLPFHHLSKCEASFDLVRLENWASLSSFALFFEILCVPIYMCVCMCCVYEYPDLKYFQTCLIHKHKFHLTRRERRTLVAAAQNVCVGSSCMM